MTTPSDTPTIVHRFLQRAAQDPDRAALHIKVNGRFCAFTWQQVAGDVRGAALGLRALGIHPGDRVAHLGQNSYEWIVADLAIQLVRAVHVPLHVSLAAEQLLQQVQHSEARTLLVSSHLRTAALAQMEAQRPTGLQAVHLSGRQRTRTARPTLDLGRPLRADDAAAAERLSRDARDHLTADSLATILYTSGTTGEPKAVMLSQGNLVFSAESTVQMKKLTPQDVRLIFLPLSHPLIFRTAGTRRNVAVDSAARPRGRCGTDGEDALLPVTIDDHRDQRRGQHAGDEKKQQRSKPAWEGKQDPAQDGNDRHHNHQGLQ